MKILLIAPRHRDINQIPEIRQLTSLHRTTVLNGEITIQNIFDEVRQQNYDIVHFATDLISEKNDEMYISENESLGLADTDSILKLANAKMVFLNFCSSARFATYVTNRGLECAIYTTIEIDDKLAWRFPLAFYEQLKRKEHMTLVSYNEIYDMIAPSDGSYGWIAGIKFYQSFYKILRESIEELNKKIDKLSEDVKKHSNLLGTDGFTGKINNKWILTIMFLFILLVIVSSSMIIYSNILIMTGG